MQVCRLRSAAARPLSSNLIKGGCVNVASSCGMVNSCSGWEGWVPLDCCRPLAWYNFGVQLIPDLSKTWDAGLNLHWKYPCCSLNRLTNVTDLMSVALQAREGVANLDLSMPRFTVQGFGGTDPFQEAADGSSAPDSSLCQSAVYKRSIREICSRLASQHALCSVCCAGNSL